MEIVTKVMEKSWKFVGKNVYEPCFKRAKIQKTFKQNNTVCWKLMKS